MPVVINGTTGIVNPDGSASTPSLAGTDTNTGMFFPAADTIAFAEGGAEVMRIDSAGNVGIGTSSPGYKFEINSGTNAFPARITTTNSSNSLLSFGDASTTGIGPVIGSNGNALVFGRGGVAEYARIDSSGNLTLSNQPSFKVGTAGATVANGSILPFDTAYYNRGNCFNTSTYRFTAPVAGYYVFGGMVRIDGSWSYLHLMSYVNGVLSNQGNELPGLTSTPTTGGPGFAAGAVAYARYLNAGDYISFSINSTSGPFYVHQQSYLYGYLVG